MIVLRFFKWISDSVLGEGMAYPEMAGFLIFFVFVGGLAFALALVFIGFLIGSAT